MRFGPVAACALAPVLCVILSLASARADGIVNVTLQDVTDGQDVSGMKMTATPDSVKAGRVTIHANNQSEGLVHEVVVVRSKAHGGSLPYDSKTGQVIEKQIAHVGEVSDLSPRKSGSLTLRLKPGDYLLICNQPNHYKSRDVGQAYCDAVKGGSSMRTEPSPALATNSRSAFSA